MTNRLQWVVLGIGLGVTALGAAMHLLQPEFLVLMDHKVRDMLTRHAGRGEQSGTVSIVELDEKSLAQEGRWPWPRSLVANLVNRIVDAGAATVALDMMMVEPDTAGANGTGAVSNDQVMAAALGRGRVLVGHYFRFGKQDGSADCVLRPASLAIARVSEDCGPHLFEASRVTCSQPLLDNAAAGSGFLNDSPDNDGLLRRLPLLIRYHQREYPSLALATVMAHLGIQSMTLSSRSCNGATLRAGDRLAPVDSRAALYLRFRGPARTFPYVSAADVLSGQFQPEALHGKIVIVGGSAIGLQEVVATPVDTLFPAVELQATAIDNLLRQDYLAAVPSGSPLEWALLLAVGSGSALVLSRFRPLWGALITLGLLAATWLICSISLARGFAFASPLFAFLIGGFNLGLLSVINLVAERRKSERALRQLQAAREFTVSAMALLTELRDFETGSHLVRIQHYTRVLCQSLASHPRFRHFLTPETIDILVQLVKVHDIGKVGIPDKILQKPGRLTAEEYQIVKLHVVHGRDVLEKARAQSGIEDAALIQMAQELVYSHHERWDGSGYPEGLRNESIPIPGRLLAVVDTYDALVSKRVYKDRVAHAEAVRIIQAARGVLFDPDVVDAFLDEQQAWYRISLTYSDDSLESAAAGF